MQLSSLSELRLGSQVFFFGLIIVVRWSVHRSLLCKIENLFETFVGHNWTSVFLDAAALDFCLQSKLSRREKLSGKWPPRLWAPFVLQKRTCPFFVNPYNHDRFVSFGRFQKSPFPGSLRHIYPGKSSHKGKSSRGWSGCAGDLGKTVHPGQWVLAYKKTVVLWSVSLLQISMSSDEPNRTCVLCWTEGDWQLSTKLLTFHSHTHKKKPKQQQTNQGVAFSVWFLFIYFFKLSLLWHFDRAESSVLCGMNQVKVNVMSWTLVSTNWLAQLFFVTHKECAHPCPVSDQIVVTFDLMHPRRIGKSCGMADWEEDLQLITTKIADLCLQDVGVLVECLTLNLLSLISIV